jgi:hypothetical protein
VRSGFAIQEGARDDLLRLLDFRLDRATISKTPTTHSWRSIAVVGLSESPMPRPSEGREGDLRRR